MSEEIRRLEEKVAYLERHVAEQDKAMLEMAEDIARLRRELMGMRDRISSGSQRGGSDRPEDERPPHY